MRATEPHPKSIRRMEEVVRETLRADDDAGLENLLARTHPADIAEIIDHLEHSDQLRVFRVLVPEIVPEVLGEAGLEAARELLAGSTCQHVGDRLMLLPTADAAEVLSEDVPEGRNALLGEMDVTGAAQVRTLLQYPPHSAGRLMTPHFARVYPDMTAAQTTGYLHCIDPQVQTLDNLFVMHTEERLLGVVSLTDVLRASPEMRLAELMNAEPVTVDPFTDQQEVARLVSHYDLSFIAVVESGGRMLGIVISSQSVM